jgi:hypothetical protein
MNIHASNPVKVGAFFYVWYDATYWSVGNVYDKPLLDYYVSNDTAIITQQLKWVSDAYIDFLLISWWGHYPDTEIPQHPFRNNATYQVFQTAKDNATNVKLAVMVEPFNLTENPTYTYSEIYDYVYTTFYEGFPAFYFKIDDKPLICFWNDPYLTPNGIFERDPRFTVKIVGGNSYANWIYEDVRETYRSKPYPPRERQTPVTPRFDDYFVRYPNNTYDAELLHLYKEQWERALKFAKKGNVDFITICSWNEYPERTAIEPHQDYTSWNNDPYYLYNMTKDYITELKGITPTLEKPMYWYQNPLIFGVIILGICVGVWILWKS